MQQQAFASYFATGALSGCAAPVVNNPVMLDLLPRAKCARTSAGALDRRKHRAAWRRALEEAELRERATEEGDVRGRWPIMGYLDIRQVPGYTRRFEALVQWRGDQWVGHNSWEPLAHLTVDVRCAA